MTAAAHAAISPLHEHALHAWLIARLERSYWHDVRNGLQGLYGTMDAMGRALRSPGTTSVPADKLVAMGRQALAAHEQSLQAVVRELLWQRTAPAPLDLNELLETVVRFLRNDATAHGITLRVLGCGPAHVVACGETLRFVLLCLLVHAIDRGGSGELLLGCEGGAHCTVTVQWPEAAMSAEQVPTATDSFWYQLIVPVARGLVQAEGGELFAADVAAGRRAVRFSLPAAPSA